MGVDDEAVNVAFQPTREIHVSRLIVHRMKPLDLIKVRHHVLVMEAPSNWPANMLPVTCVWQR